ncbi:hypothetical protein KKF03_03880 [Patescibacteria group bacterium]|nr:hypothetical protein [Patescibacteria group bacterium]
MRKFLSFTVLIPSLFLAACTAQAPLNEDQQAAKYGMTIERYREEKSAAARMNMSWEEHVKMIQMDKDMPMEGHDMDNM